MGLANLDQSVELLNFKHLRRQIFYIALGDGICQQSIVTSDRDSIVSTEI